MATPIVAGVGVAALAMTGRAAILAFEAWKTAPPRLRKFYEGGFEPDMTRREASLILGVGLSPHSLQGVSDCEWLRDHTGWLHGPNRLSSTGFLPGRPLGYVDHTRWHALVFCPGVRLPSWTVRAVINRMCFDAQPQRE